MRVVASPSDNKASSRVLLPHVEASSHFVPQHPGCNRICRGNGAPNVCTRPMPPIMITHNSWYHRTHRSRTPCIQQLLMVLHAVLIKADVPNVSTVWTKGYVPRGWISPWEIVIRRPSISAVITVSLAICNFQNIPELWSSHFNRVKLEIFAIKPVIRFISRSSWAGREGNSERRVYDSRNEGMTILITLIIHGLSDGACSRSHGSSPSLVVKACRSRSSIK